MTRDEIERRAREIMTSYKPHFDGTAIDDNAAYTEMHDTIAAALVEMWDAALEESALVCTESRDEDIRKEIRAKKLGGPR